jgi:chromosome segregation ATPase
LLLPETFVVTEQPLNPEETGIRKVAEVDPVVTEAVQQYAELEPESGENNEDGTASVEQSMAEGEEPGQQTLSALQGKLEDKEAELEQTKDRIAELEDKAEAFNQLTEAFAENDDADEVEPEQVADRVASLQKEKEALEDRVNQLEDAHAEQAFEQFAENVLAGRVPTENWAEWKEDFFEDPEATRRRAETIPENTVLGESEAEGEGGGSQALQDDEMDALDTAIAEHLGVDEEGN